MLCIIFFFQQKFREYLLGSSRIARLEAKGGFLRGRIGSAARAGAPPALSSHMHPAPRHRYNEHFFISMCLFYYFCYNMFYIYL